MARIDQVIYQDQFLRINEDMRNACEVVHYAILNDQPVDLKHIYKLQPDFEVESNKSAADQHNEWLKGKHGMENQDTVVEVEDTFGIREGARGKKDQNQWNLKGEHGGFDVFGNQNSPKK